MKVVSKVVSFSGQRISKSVLVRASRILEKKDRGKAFILFLAYAFMGILDVIAVVTVGIIGSLAVSGVSSNQPGNRVSLILEFVKLEDSSLQRQVSILGVGAATILVSKSLISLYLSKRILLFLGRRSAVISQRLVNHLFYRDIISIREKTIQETIYALTGGVNLIVVGVFGASILLASDFLLLLMFGLTLFFVDTTVAFSSLIFFVGLGFMLYRYMHVRASILGARTTKLEISSSERIMEIVSCYRELLVKNRREFLSHQISAMRWEIAEASAKLSVMSLLSKYIMEIAMVVGALFVGALQFLTQPATRAVAVISVFIVSSARIVPGVLRVQTGLVGIRSAIAAASPTLQLVEEHFHSLVNSPRKDLPPYRGKYSHPGFSAEVVMDNVSFRYPSRETLAVKNVSFKVNSGEFIGIVGPSGSGKSTLVDLMLGVIYPKEGRIKISGLTPIDAIQKWPGATGYVPQETNFINGTIKDNVCLGFATHEVSDEDVSPIIESVQLGDLLELPEGLHTQIGERGGRLSGGQRQRLGIARALFTNPKLLILDEATSSLDAGTEAKLTEYLESIKGSLTLVVIAHRLSTVLKADRLIYMKNGELVGTGTFHELRERIPEFDFQASAMGISRI